MIKNYLTITVRNFIRNWNHSLINTLGLGVGLAACIIIFLIIDFEKSFDDFHVQRDRLYRVVADKVSASGTEYQATTPYPFIQAFRTDFPQIQATQFHFHEEAQVSYGVEKVKVEEIVFADSVFSRVFSYTFLSGNPQVDLGRPGQVFLTESLAKKINADGKLKTIKLNNLMELEIAGTVADPPANSHIPFSMVVSMPSLSAEFLGMPIDQWGMTIAGFSYVTLPENIQPQAVEDQLKIFVKKYFSEESSKRVYKLQPLSDIHFNTELSSTPNGGPGSGTSNLTVLAFLGGFILLIACINFINLTTAQAVKKSREIGVRKTLGANRPQLIRQFLGETFLITLVSALIGLLMAELSIESLNTFLGKELTLSLFTNPALLGFLICIIFITGLLSGIYPAFVLSGFNPIAVLKNKLTYQGTSGAQARKYLVVFQFIVAQMLVIGTLVVANQMNFIRTKPLGFAKEGVVNVELPNNDFQKMIALRTQLENVSGVEAISLSLGAPTSDNNFNTGFTLPERGDNNRFDTQIKPVDSRYLETYQLKLKAGRWFSESDERATEPTITEAEKKYYYVVNETLAKKLGFASVDEIVGKRIVTGLYDIEAEVIGVVADFHANSLHQLVQPVVLVHFPHFYYEAGVRFNSSNINQLMNDIKQAYASVYPDFLMDYFFLDEHLDSLYREEERSFALIQIFAALSIFISCLGLYGLISFLTQQKSKEVGIRKVFGASVAQIVILFSRSYAGLVIAAFVVAAPVAWYFMSQWLNEFAYHVNINVLIPLGALLLTIFMALITVGYQSVKAAMANPVKSLRSE